MIKKQVIICDDDEGILEMMTFALENNDFVIIPLLSSSGLPNLIEQLEPDLLLLDLWMPVLSGEVLLKQLRANPKTMFLPIIVMSASTDGREVAEENGATDFIAKPFDLDKINFKIRNLLHLS